MEGKFMNLLKAKGIEPGELVLQKKWLDDQYAVLSCGDETEYYEAEGLLDLVEGILRILSSEDKNIRNIYPPKTERHTAYCSECGSLLRWKWDPQLGGMDAYCPGCGKVTSFCDDPMSGDALPPGDGILDSTLQAAGVNLTPEKFTAYMDWLNDQHAYLSPSGSDTVTEVEGLITLMEALQPALEKESGRCYYLPVTYEVTEYCSECESEITMRWNIREDGMKAYCPVCGKRLMLCSMCAIRTTTCDYDNDTDTCFFNRN